MKNKIVLLLIGALWIITPQVSNAAFPVKSNPVAEQKTITDKGGTMRLGAWKCDLKSDSLAYKIYGKSTISERHRHRYEFNNDYYDAFIKAGLVASGKNPETGLVEIVELPNHPFFIGVQYHPELKSTAEVPAPLFVSFLAAAKQYQASKLLNNLNY